MAWENAGKNHTIMGAVRVYLTSNVAENNIMWEMKHLKPHGPIDRKRSI